MWYDVLVLAILIVSMVRGAVRGVVWQLAGIAGILLCLVFAETISAVGAPYVGLEPPLNQWVVMFVAYLFFSFLSFGFARLINGALEKAELKEYNKHLGAIFGVVKGAMFCLVLTFFLVTLSESTREMLKDSKSARYAAIIMDRLHPVMPEKIHGALAKYIHSLDSPDLDLKNRDVSHRPSDPNQPAGDSSAWDPFGTAATQPAGGGPSTDRIGSPFETGSSGTPQVSQPAAPRAGDAVDELLKRIPGLSNAYTRDTARQVYEATPQSNRQQLIQDLQKAGPAMLFAVLQRWQSAPAQPAAPQPPSQNFGWTPNSGSTQPVGFSQPPVATRESLSTAIAQQLARGPQARPAYEYEQYITGGLQGLPDAVSLDVLKDWHADLTSAAADPDPSTTAGTKLDLRIIRQLTVHRVSVHKLSQELRSRLMQARQ